MRLPSPRFITRATIAMPIAVVLLVALPCAAETTAVAVFNFHMTSDTPEWVWLEKGLADRVTTDLFQSRVVDLMARDRMQELAEKMTWVPEMMEDPKQLKRIGYKTGYVISGAYTVQDDKLTITAQVVNFETTKEVFRRQVSGPAAEALDLVRQLSAELLAWLTHKTPEEVKGDLPAWTRSIPAAKALYEGVDLYDQGRYAEGWLSFRRAAKEDPGYTEAQYWVGKMYYFMNRYDHARREFEAFVYRDQTHPRIGDAIKEYADTYEKTDTPPEVLLSLYGKLTEKYGGITETDEIRIGGYYYGDGGPPAAWLTMRRALLFEHIERYKESVETLTRYANTEKGRSADWNLAENTLRRIMREHHAWTGDTFSRNELGMFYFTSWEKVALFREGSCEAFPERLSRRAVVLGSPTRGEYFRASDSFVVAAPAGLVFTKLTFYPQTKASSGTFGVTLTKDIHDDVGESEADLTDATQHGITFDNLPLCGILRARCQARTDAPAEYKSHLLRNVRITAEFAGVEEHGVIEILGTNAASIRTDVDGHFARMGPGLIGLVPPGEHVLRFYTQDTVQPLSEVQTTVTVEVGKKVKVNASMPWKKESSWASFSCPLAVGGDYENYFRTYNARFAQETAHAVHADSDGIWVVWPYGYDLWSSWSKDGVAFSPARRLELPVSSAWVEMKPQLFRDETGRFILAFCSTRGMRHGEDGYICWSRDFEHWSAPCRMPAYGPMTLDDGGQLVMLSGWATTTVWTSRDGLQWKRTAGPQNPERRMEPYRVFQNKSGTYDLFLIESQRSGFLRPDSPPHRLLLYNSSDCVTWSEPVEAAAYRQRDDWFICNVVPYKDSYVAVLGAKDAKKDYPYLQPIYRKDDGAWHRLPKVPDVVNGLRTVAYDDHWGYVITWKVAQGYEWCPHPEAGPFVTRGPDMKFLFSGDPDDPEIAVEFETPEQFLANWRESDYNHMPALQYAAFRNRKDVAQILLDRGTDVNCRNSWGKTALHEAVGNTIEYTGVVELLIQRGADIDAQDDEGETPLHVAARQGTLIMCKLLIGNKANVMATDNLGRTPLHKAASEGNADVVEYLLANGAQVNAKDREGITPLKRALIEKTRPIMADSQPMKRAIELLKEHGGHE
ncbi:MAG: ankyrin repeat domain-containing protein [Planctomycetes bacterium]|nr:ankyrin repeat domain-containing protein [Planctomycetota bacterium]